MIEKMDLPLDYVYHGDVMELAKTLPANSIDCIYGDPDYNVGVKYNDKSYRREFNAYMDWYIAMAKECHRVLKDAGNLFFINYPKQNAHLRVRYLDDAFYDVNEYVWVYNTNVGHSPRHFTTAHRSILHCVKSKNNAFYKHQVAEPYKNPTDHRIKKNLANGSKGRMPYSWQYYDLVKNVSRQKTVHSCQIPEGLSELLFKACTKENDVIFILFGGSGSEISVCQRLGRRFISAEIDDRYYQMILDRIAKNGEIDHEYKLKIRRSRTTGSPTQQVTFTEQ